MWKDLRAMLGQKVAGAYHLRYCGKGTVATCARGARRPWGAR
jgi:hypothetical protein